MKIPRLSRRGIPAPGAHLTFAQVCSRRVTKEYRLFDSTFRVFVNPGVPILASPTLNSRQSGAHAEQPRGVDASLHEVYSELAVAEAAGAAPPPLSAHESS